MKTIATFAAPEDYQIESEVMNGHQKSSIGNDLIRTYMDRESSGAANVAIVFISGNDWKPNSLINRGKSVSNDSNVFLPYHTPQL